MKQRMLDTEHLEKIRHKKRMKKLRAAILLCLLLVVLLVWLTGLGSRYITKISDFFVTMDLQMHPGAGFPVSLVMDTDTRSEPMTNALVLMDSRDVYVYSSTGSALRNFQHGYAHPGLSAGRTRFCIYNQGGRELRIEGREQSFGTLNTDRAIQFVTMSANGNFAVVTQSDSYQAQMTVYSDEMDKLFAWYCADDYPTCADFDPLGETVAVGCASTAGDGTLRSVLYLVNENGEKEKVERDNSMILQISFRAENRLAVAYDDALVLYDAENMKEIESYALTEPLLCADLSSDEGILLVQGESGRETGVSMTILSDTLKQERSETIGTMVTQCRLAKNAAWMIGKEEVFCYTVNKEEGKDFSQQLDHRPICLIGGDPMLLLTAKQIMEIVPETAGDNP